MGDEAANINLGWESFKGSIGKVLQAVVGFLGTVVFARVLGPTSFGGFYFLLSILYLVDRPLHGVSDALNKRFSESDAPRRELFGATLLINAAAVVLIAAVMALLRGWFESFTNVPNAAFVFFVLFASSALFVPNQRLIAAIGMPSRQTWNDTLRSLLTFPLQIWFVLVGFGAAGMGYGLAAATLVTGATAWLFVGVTPAFPSVETLRSLWRFAKYSVPSGFFGKAYNEFDSLLLGAVLTTAVVGEYQAAFKLTVPALFIGTVVVSGLLPKVSNLSSRGEEVVEDVQNVIAYTSLLAIPIFFGSLAIPEQLIVTAFGGEYRDGAILLVGIALYRLFETQRLVFSGTLKGIDRPSLVMKIDAFALAFNVVLGFALVYEIGPIGVVLATVLAEASRYALLAYLINERFDDVRLVPQPLMEQFAAGTIMFLVVGSSSRLVTGASWFNTALLVGIGGAVYMGVLFAISANFRVTVRSLYHDSGLGS